MQTLNGEESMYVGKCRLFDTKCDRVGRACVFRLKTGVCTAALRCRTDEELSPPSKSTPIDVEIASGGGARSAAEREVVFLLLVIAVF